MKYKRGKYIIGDIITGFVIITLFLFSFSASAKDKNIEVVKGKKLREAAPSYWENAKTVSIYYLGKKLRPDMSPFMSPIMASIGNLGSMDTAFQEKINNCLQSYHWKIDEYFVEQLKQELRLKNKDVTISTIDLSDKDHTNLVKNVQPSDKHIVLSLHFNVVGVRNKAPLNGDIGVAIATEEAMQQFIKSCNTLPLLAGGHAIHPARKENQLSQNLEQLKLYPGLYMGNVSKRAKEFDKDKWLSENGAFLERELQSLVNDLAKGVSDLFF